jgi:hypothetical protein
MPDLTITRVFDAPRDLVFKAWTDSAHGNDWSAPRGFRHREGWSECFDRLEEHLAGVDSANPRSTFR